MAEKLGKRLLFIGGMPRSGTTLFRDLLNDVPDILVLPSDYCLYSNFDKLNDASVFPDSSNADEIRKWHNEIIKKTPVVKWGILADELNFSTGTIGYFDYCDAMYLAFINKNSRYSTYIFKAPLLEFKFQQIASRPWLNDFANWFVYMLRNPLKQARSFKFSANSWNQTAIAPRLNLYNYALWNESLLLYTFFEKNVRSDSQLFRYEEVIGLTADLSRLLAFCGLAADHKVSFKAKGSPSSIKSTDENLSKDEEAAGIAICGALAAHYYPEFAGSEMLRLERKFRQIAFMDGVSAGNLLGQAIKGYSNRAFNKVIRVFDRLSRKKDYSQKVESYNYKGLDA